jgi:hypothetical protein
LATPTKLTPEQDAMRKAALIQAVSQLDMMLGVFGEAPEKVKKAAQEFRDALKEWSDA